MKVFCWVSAILFSAISLATVPARAATYTNVRYGYHVTYPSDFLLAEREADAGDGCSFHAAQSSAKMFVWATWNLHDDAVDQSPRGVADEAASDCARGSISYKVVKPNLVALSCVTSKGGVIYQKTLISNNLLTSIRFEYPDSEKARWDKIVQSVAASLQQGKPAQ